jgi:hypothetical protein
MTKIAVVLLLSIICFISTEGCDCTRPVMEITKSSSFCNFKCCVEYAVANNQTTHDCKNVMKSNFFQIGNAQVIAETKEIMVEKKENINLENIINTFKKGKENI